MDFNSNWSTLRFVKAITDIIERLSWIPLPIWYGAPRILLKWMIFRQMMHMDPPMATFSKNDGMISLLHCQEWNILCSFFMWVCLIIKLWCYTKVLWMLKFHQQLKCESLAQCIAYTFEQSKLICILHSSTNKGQRYIRGKQTGTKKTDFILSLPEMSYCSEKIRKKRCRREPKCHHVNCLRNAQK